MTLLTITDAEKIELFAAPGGTGHIYNMYKGAAAALVADHELTDAKGRRIGGVAKITQGTDGAFFLRLFATRNGDQFGAWPPCKRAGSTLEEAIATATRKITAQGKRYARLAGK